MSSAKSRTMAGIEHKAAEQADFDRRCEIVRSTPITQEMTYKERLEMKLKRYGV